MKQETPIQQLSPHFSLKEMTESPTARMHGIDNTPSSEALENLRRLCHGTLEPLREALGQPVIITSGYRCWALNNILSHSSKHSQHMTGQAADFYIGHTLMSRLLGFSRRELLIKAFRQILTNEHIDYDQLIIYPTFIHVSYVSPQANRHGIMIGQRDGKLGYGRITQSNALKIS